MRNKITGSFFAVIIGLLVICTLGSCKLLFGVLYSGIGPGHIRYYDYGVSKEVLKRNITDFIQTNPSYKATEKWSDYTKGYSFTDEFFVYYEGEPEELYWVQYYGDERYWKEHPDNSRLILIGVALYGKPWRQYDGFKLWYRGKKRIEKRFETEILSKLKYSYTKIK